MARRETSGEKYKCERSAGTADVLLADLAG